MKRPPFSTAGDYQFGPVTARLDKGRALVRITAAIPPTATRWPLPLELDIAEAIDDIVAQHPNHEIVPDGWSPSLQLCPFLHGKLQILALGWQTLGKYPKF